MLTMGKGGIFVHTKTSIKHTHFSKCLICECNIAFLEHLVATNLTIHVWVCTRLFCSFALPLISDLVWWLFSFPWIACFKLFMSPRSCCLHSLWPLVTSLSSSPRLLCDAVIIIMVLFVLQHECWITQCLPPRTVHIIEPNHHMNIT